MAIIKLKYEEMFLRETSVCVKSLDDKKKAPEFSRMHNSIKLCTKIKISLISQMSSTTKIQLFCKPRTFGFVIHACRQ